MTAARLLGALLVAAAGTALGLQAAGRLRQRTAVLSAVVGVLTLLRGEIGDRRSPMPEIAARLAREAPECCRGWFVRLEAGLSRLNGESFAAVWRRTLEEAELPLDGEERESLARLGLSLGRYDAPEQSAAIDRCLREMEAFRARAGETARTQGRLYTGLGLAGGLMLAVILL